MSVISSLSRLSGFNESVDVAPTKFRFQTRDVLPSIRRYWLKHSEPLELELPHFPFLQERYKPYHFNDALERLSAQSLRASPGLRFGQRFRTKGAVLKDPKAYNDLRCFVHNLKKGLPRSASPVQPCIVSATKDIHGNIKTRLAWPFPIEVVAVEAMFARPIIDALPENYIPSPETHHKTFCGSGYSVDFSSFDQSVPLWIMKLCFDNLMSRFDLTAYADLGDGQQPVKPIRLERCIRYIRRYLCYTPFRIGKRLFYKYHGMPSGSMFTNILDSMISYTVMYWSHKIAGCSPIITTYGDDTHIAKCRCFNVKGIGPSSLTLVERVHRIFGMQIKVQEKEAWHCHAYCKKRCALGHTFHDGLWFANIINCCQHKYRRAVAYQLAQPIFQATKRQRDQLLAIGRPGHLPPRIQAYLDSATLQCLRQF